MQSRTLYSFCGLALLMWGCPKRQTAPRLVYVPSPPPAAGQKPSSANGSLVIQEPAPEEPPQPIIVQEEAPPEEKQTQRKRHTIPPGRPETGSQEDTPPPAAPEVPALEQRESAAQQTAQRQQIIEMLAGIRGRVTQFKRDRMGEAERKTLDDAQMFLEQSQHALDANDLVRALNLARKASLLVNAVQ